jgi:hypothetical protein
LSPIKSDTYAGTDVVRVDRHEGILRYSNGAPVELCVIHELMPLPMPSKEALMVIHGVSVKINTRSKKFFKTLSMVRKNCLNRISPPCIYEGG